VEAKSVSNAMKTGLILKLDDLINWCNSRVFSSDKVFGNHRRLESSFLPPSGGFGLLMLGLY
jgi:hypothetical protein